MNGKQLPANHTPEDQSMKPSNTKKEANTNIRRGEMDGTKPFTNRASKMVMLRGERGDPIQIDEVVTEFEDNSQFPSTVEIRQRNSTFYGTELLCEASDSKMKYLLTAPGPDAFLYLWGSATDSDGFREKWYTIAEVKASFTNSLPQYPICSNCGNPIKSLEHERLSSIDECSSLDN